MSSSSVSQLLTPSLWSLGTPQCRRSSPLSLSLRQNTSVMRSARKRFSSISSSQSLQPERQLHYDDDLIHPELVPKHIALIMDGNRRWAKAKGLPVLEGHKLIIPKLKEICGISSKLGIQVLTAFAFSTENWNRSKEEVDFLMQLFEEFFDEFMRFGIRMSVIGCRSNLPKTLQELIALTEETTKDNAGLNLVIALNYGGHYDILQATKSITSKVMNGFLRLEDIDKKLFDQELESKCLSIPNPDLLIRTGGEQRISNFLLWQLAYSEFYFTKTLFPDFGETDLNEAVLTFQRRHRARLGELKSDL